MTKRLSKTLPSALALGAVLLTACTPSGSAAAPAAPAAPPATAEGPGTAVFDEAMKPVVEPYLRIHDALASDRTEGVAGEAKALLAALAAALPGLDPAKVSGEHAKHYADLPQSLRSAAEGLAAAKDLVAAREAFKAVSRPMAMWVTMSQPAGLDVVFCSMAKGSWVQRSGPVRNPYYGASMLACGELVGGAGASAAAGQAEGKGGGAATHP